MEPGSGSDLSPGTFSGTITELNSFTDEDAEVRAIGHRACARRQNMRARPGRRATRRAAPQITRKADQGPARRHGLAD
jgi:hypothetical protein